jgi:hypothetical protein
MSFSALYESVQALENKVSTRWLRDRAVELTGFAHVKEQWSGLINPQFIQGFFIEGPLGPPVPLKKHEALIVLARDLDKHRRRCVYTKELMHLFDTPAEKADTPEKFDAQAEKFCDPSAPTSPQFRAEQKAFWRAAAVLCPEKKRCEYKSSLVDGKTSLIVIATALQIPPSFARHLFRDDFLIILGHVKK